MIKKISLFCLGLVLMLLVSSCKTAMLPAEDIDVFEYCKKEIAILKNPRIPTNSREKYYAALSLSNKIDFSYCRTVEFLDKIFSNSDARVSQSEDLISILVYYQYEDNYVSFEFRRVGDDIVYAQVTRN